MELSGVAGVPAPAWTLVGESGDYQLLSGPGVFMFKYGGESVIVPEFPPMAVSDLRQLENLVRYRIKIPTQHHVHVFTPGEDGMQIWWSNLDGSAWTVEINGLDNALGVLSVVPTRHSINIANPTIRITIAESMATITVPEFGINTLMKLDDLRTLVAVYTRGKRSCGEVNIDIHRNVWFRELYIPGSFSGKFMRYASGVLKSHNGVLRKQCGLPSVLSIRAAKREAAAIHPSKLIVGDVVMDMVYEPWYRNK